MKTRLVPIAMWFVIGLVACSAPTSSTTKAPGTTMPTGELVGVVRVVGGLMAPAGHATSPPGSLIPHPCDQITIRNYGSLRRSPVQADARCRFELRARPGKYVIEVNGYDKTEVAVVAGKTVRATITFNMF